VPKRLLHLRPWKRHSFVLAVAGIVYICYGVALLAVATDPARTIGLAVATQVMSIRGWGVVWICVGTLAFLSSRWPPQSETWGYAAMSGLAAWWSACYGLAVLVVDEAPNSGVTAMLVWAMVAFLWWAISGLANPDDEVPHRPVGFDWSIYAPEHKATRTRKE
jgi:hypothetical protein